jgi:hypothetical protein
MSQRDAGDAVVDLCETHFQCAVCNDLLVKATGLQCGHVFCRECVSKWQKKSESSTDPLLRGKRATWYRFCETPFRPKSFLTNFLVDNTSSKN